MIIAKKQLPYSSIFSGSLTGLIVLCLSLTACDKPAGEGAYKVRDQSPLHRVEVATVERKPVTLTQTVSGTLEAVTRIRLYNEEDGRIIKLPFHEGDRVKKGTLLVQLDNELLKTEVAKAKATREQKQIDLDRLKKLLPKKIATEEDVANAKTALNIAIAEEKQQLTRLKRTSIKAPIDGLITERLYEPGDQLTAFSHIHTIIDPNRLQLTASIAERWIPLIQEQQTVDMRIDALGDKRYLATIVRIHPTINASTHKGTIEIVLKPVPAGARVGQFARANIELYASDRLVVPAHTVHFEPEGAFVFRIRTDDNGDKVAEKVFFEQGQQFGSATEVLSGLHPGDRVVSRGYLSLRDGKKVTVANDSPGDDSGNGEPANNKPGNDKPANNMPGNDNPANSGPANSGLDNSKH